MPEILSHSLVALDTVPTVQGLIMSEMENTLCVILAIVYGDMSRVMRKSDFCISENKGTDQLLAIFCGCAVQFVSELVVNPKDRFSPDAAHITVSIASLLSSH